MNTRKFKNLNADGTRIEIKLNEPETDDIYQWMQQCFDELLHVIKIRLKIENQDRVGFSFNNMNESHAESGISFRRFDQFNSNLILSSLENVLQSNSNFLLDDMLTIRVDVARIDRGGMRIMNIGKSKDRYYKIHSR